jgi:Icc-related predicted phosphoesterase
MRILLVSDLHYTLKQFDWVTSVASEYDLVVVAGDSLSIASPVDPDAQIAVVLEYLARMAVQTTVIACSGNHDLNARNDLGERAALWLPAARDAGVIVDGASLSREDALVTVCAWWDGAGTRERVDQQLADDAETVGDRPWMWVYHAPPDASPTSWTGKRHYGDEDLVKWIDRYQPAVVLCGHVHESPFATGGSWIDRIGSTAVLNAGRQRGPLPTHVEIDTDSGLASWRSLLDRDERSFVEA